MIWGGLDFSKVKTEVAVDHMTWKASRDNLL